MKSMLLIFIIPLTCWAADSEQPTPDKGAAQFLESKAYQDRVQKVNILDERVKTLEREFRQIVAMKRATNSVEEKRQSIERMKAVYAEYSTAMDELNEIKRELRYKFPAEGRASGIQYSEVEKRSPEELEESVDLTGALQETKEAMESKYKVFMPPKPLRPEEVVEETKLKETKNRLRLER